MKRMRSKTILLDVKNVASDMYILPNHNDYEYIDVYVSRIDGSYGQTIRIYKEQEGDILITEKLSIIKGTYLSITLLGLVDYNIFAVGWK